MRTIITIILSIHVMKVTMPLRAVYEDQPIYIENTVIDDIETREI